MYSCLHWLAYWNDVESIDYMLNLVPDHYDQFQKIMGLNASDMTPLDIAGQHMCHESALLIIEHLTTKFDLLEQVYKTPLKPSGKSKILGVKI